MQLPSSPSLFYFCALPVALNFLKCALLQPCKRVYYCDVLYSYICDNRKANVNAKAAASRVESSRVGMACEMRNQAPFTLYNLPRCGVAARRGLSVPASMTIRHTHTAIHCIDQIGTAVRYSAFLRIMSFFMCKYQIG